MLLEAVVVNLIEIKSLADSIGWFVLGFVVGAHEQFSDETHQDGLETQYEEHDAHLEKG